MLIQSKTIDLSAAKTVTLDHLDENHPIYEDPARKVLTVSVNMTQPDPSKPAQPQMTVQFLGAEYDAFYTSYGDGWTPVNLNEAIMAKLGLTAAE